jgi:SAM-dependent methyltransferase
MAGEIVNVEQAANWDGPDGEYWVAHQARFDNSILPHHHRLMAAAAIAPGERVLDIGCGNGITSRDAARATGPGGSVFAADLSGPMLGRAEQAAKDEGLGNITFQQADAQVHPFEPGAFDVVISRFGVMFFNDPVAAFTNIGTAVRSGGRLAMLVWGPLATNEWITTLREALAVGRDLPVPPPGVPSPFGLADQAFATDVLTRAGFTDVAFELSEQPFHVGTDADDAYGFVAGLQPVLMLLADLDEAQKAEALDNLRANVAAHATPDGVVFGSTSWVMTARRP